MISLSVFVALLICAVLGVAAVHVTPGRQQTVIFGSAALQGLVLLVWLLGLIPGLAYFAVVVFQIGYFVGGVRKEFAQAAS